MGAVGFVQFTDPDVSTYGRTLAQAKRYAREALAVWLDLSSVDELDPCGARLVDVIELPAGMAEDVSRLRDQRVAAEQLRHEVAVRTADAARRLLAAGWPLEISSPHPTCPLATYGRSPVSARADRAGGGTPRSR
jgi:hypothetical protein